MRQSAWHMAHHTFGQRHAVDFQADDERAAIILAAAEHLLEPLERIDDLRTRFADDPERGSSDEAAGAEFRAVEDGEDVVLGVAEGLLVLGVEQLRDEVVGRLAVEAGAFELGAKSLHLTELREELI